MGFLTLSLTKVGYVTGLSMHIPNQKAAQVAAVVKKYSLDPETVAFVD